jgi:DNA-binding CsgD family transcriptional regulator
MFMVIDFASYENIDTVKYRDKIRRLYDEYCLFNKTGITNFCICICFRDNRKYYLSNMPDWAIQWRKAGGSRSDEVFDLELMKHKDYFFPRKSEYDMVQNSLVIREENEFNYFDTYSLIRRHIDCTFILLALHNKKIENPEEVYTNTRSEFENFCIFFIKNMLIEIMLSNKEYRVLQILSDRNLLEKVIKHGRVKQIDKLTERECECIKLIKINYPPKIIARTMSISEKTVRNYIESIKLKLQCVSIGDICEKAVQYDL